jgi:peptidylprolyl isomerase
MHRTTLIANHPTGGWPRTLLALTSRPMASEFPPFDGSAPKKQDFKSPPEMGIDPAKRYTATLDTSLGEIVIALDAIKAPKTVNNFVFLALHHYYDGVIFHRIINGFMCQGGDPTGTGRGGPGYRFEDELPKPREYQIGSVAMANAGPNTNGSQFFLISGPSGVGLPPQYSLFGQIVKGLDVLDTMQRVKTGASDRPADDVVINSVAITESD